MQDMAIFKENPSQTLTFRVTVRKMEGSHYTDTIKVSDHHQIKFSSFLHLLHEWCDSIQSIQTHTIIANPEFLRKLQYINVLLLHNFKPHQ